LHHQANRALSRRRLVLGTGLALANVAAGGLRAQTGPAGFRILRARPGEALLRGEGQPRTPIWCFDDMVPGQMLRVRRGDELRVRVFNDLPEPFALHWHGVRLPNAMDGVPFLTQPPIKPGDSFGYRFTARDAGTFWYHPVGVGMAEPGRGLHGVLVVGESERIEVDRDLALVIDDWPLSLDGRIASPPQGRNGHMTVNGVPAREVAVRPNERLRIRLINAAPARSFELAFERHAPWVMAIDGQPAEPFLARDGRVALGPGNRIDLFIDMGLAAGTSAPILSEGAPIAHLAYEHGDPVRAAPLPEPKPLPPNPLPERLDFRAALKLDLPLDAPSRLLPEERPPLFSVRRRRIVMLGLANAGDAAQAVHLHGHHVRLLDKLDDGWKPFWLDTVPVPARETSRIAFLADNPGKWLIEWRMLNERGPFAAAWFEVT